MSRTLSRLEKKLASVTGSQFRDIEIDPETRYWSVEIDGTKYTCQTPMTTCVRSTRTLVLDPETGTITCTPRPLKTEEVIAMAKRKRSVFLQKQASLRSRTSYLVQYLEQVRAHEQSLRNSVVKEDQDLTVSETEVEISDFVAQLSEAGFSIRYNSDGTSEWEIDTNAILPGSTVSLSPRSDKVEIAVRSPGTKTTFAKTQHRAPYALAAMVGSVFEEHTGSWPEPSLLTFIKAQQ